MPATRELFIWLWLVTLTILSVGHGIDIDRRLNRAALPPLGSIDTQALHECLKTGCMRLVQP